MRECISIWLNHFEQWELNQISHINAVAGFFEVAFLWSSNMLQDIKGCVNKISSLGLGTKFISDGDAHTHISDGDAYIYICRKREEVDEDQHKSTRISTAASKGISSNSRRTVDRSGRPSAEAAERSTGRSTVVHTHAQQTCTGIAVDRPGRPTESA